MVKATSMEKENAATTTVTYVANIWSCHQQRSHCCHTYKQLHVTTMIDTVFLLEFSYTTNPKGW